MAFKKLVVWLIVFVILIILFFTYKNKTTRKKSIDLIKQNQADIRIRPYEKQLENLVNKSKRTELTPEELDQAHKLERQIDEIVNSVNPKVAKQTQQYPTSSATKPAPQKKEKWVFGFYSTAEEREDSAKKGLVLSPGREHDVIEFIKRNDHEFYLSYKGTGRIARKFVLRRDSEGFLSGASSKEDQGEGREVRISLIEDKRSPGDYVGFLCDWDARHPKIKYTTVKAYLKRI